MTVGLSFKTDWNHAAGDYAKHRAGFPDWFFDRVVAAGLFRPGMRVLDLATGTGTLARGFARRGGIVTGLDIAPEMLAQAKALDAEAGISVEYVQAKAEATGLADAGFDLISAGTCWFWVDGPATTREASRLLRPGGAMLIAMLAWLPNGDNIVRSSERLIEKHNPKWDKGNLQFGAAGFLQDLALAGFGHRESFSVDYDITYSHEAWRGRIRASAGISAASLSPEEVAAFDAEHAAMLARDFPGEPMQVPHRVVASWGKK
jgi:SAM-dependent methyltransferase